MLLAMSSVHPSDPARKAADQDPRVRRAGEQDGPASLQAGLFVVSTPIGNLRDVTLRALDVLAAVDEVLAEDTRLARRLLDAHGIKASVTPYHDHNGARRRPELIDRLTAGARLALISDAGTPLVSDPGWKLVREATEAGIAVIPIPGASAMLAGLVASALPSDRFLFAGFLPVRSAARRRAIAELASIPATLIVYETGPRLAAALDDLSEGLGSRREAAVARELTKLFEEVRRGTLGDLAAHYAEAGPPKGEIVVLVGPPAPTGPVGEADLDAALAGALARLPTRAAAQEVATALALPRRTVYQRALTLKRDGEAGDG